MLSDEYNPFDIEENYAEFQDICSKLKNHPFPSPWKIFFKSEESEFVSEVSEFIIEDVNLVKEGTNIADPLHVNTLPNVSKEMQSTDAPINKKKVSRLKESLMSVQDDSTFDSIKDFDIFFMTPSSQLPELFEMLDIIALNDIALSLLLNTFLHSKDRISIATAIAFVHYVIYHLIFDIKKTSSRSLLTIILKFAEAYPKAVVDELLVPYSKKDASDDFQSEIISQMSKTNLPNEYVSYSIKRILEHALPVENSFVVLQCLIERKVYHENVLYDMLLKKLLSWTSTCNKNVKFTKLLTSILSAHGNEFNDQQISTCEIVVKSNKTIIKRAAENLLKKLKAERS